MELKLTKTILYNEVRIDIYTLGQLFGAECSIFRQRQVLNRVLELFRLKCENYPIIRLLVTKYREGANKPTNVLEE